MKKKSVSKKQKSRRKKPQTSASVMQKDSARITKLAEKLFDIGVAACKEKKPNDKI